MTTADTARPDRAGTGLPVIATMTALILVGVYLLASENGGFIVDAGGSSVAIGITWVLYGAVAAWLIVRAQRYGRRPAAYWALAAAWGGLAAGAIAQRANVAFTTIVAEYSDGGDVASWTTAPVVEETVKVLGVIALAVIPAARLRGTLDGLFYGVMVGAGFLVVENFIYTMGAIDDAGSTVGAIFGMLIVRGVIGGVLSHAVYTGLNGAAIGYYLANRSERPARSLAVLVVTLCGTIAAHGIHNTRDGLTLVTFLVSLVPVAAFVVAMRAGRRSERGRLERLAMAGLGRPVVSPDDLAGLDEDDERLRRALAYVRAVEVGGPDSTAARRAAARLDESEPSAGTDTG